MSKGYNKKVLDLSAVGVYNIDMLFIETSVFTRSVLALLPDDEYSRLQDFLFKNPESGDLIKAGGGIRKLRYALPGRGKSGGVRVIYYWQKDFHKTYMLLIYPKNKKDDLTDGEVEFLRKFVKEIK
jgi:mRNA-degrading endonuclease RelE of RelBE toxin-antitoxin system